MGRNLIRGLFVGLIAVGFGLGSTRYEIGNLANSGPGLFPLIVSGLLGVIAITMIVRARQEPANHLQLPLRGILSVFAGLVGFVLLSKYLGMIAGIVFLVFTSTLAGTTYSWKRNLQVSLVLVVVAFAFQSLLGLNLGLY